MADIGDDEFSDDDFDALAGEQLFELEQRALQATQHPPNEPSQRPTKLINTHRLLDDKVRVPTPLQEQSSDYGDLDDDLLDTVIENPTGYNQVPSQGPYRPPNGTQGYAYRGQWGHNNPLPSRPIECTGPNPAFRPPRPVSGSQVNRPARPLAKQRLEATTDENYFSQKVVSSQQRTDSGPQVPAENLQAQLEQVSIQPHGHDLLLIVCI